MCFFHLFVFNKFSVLKCIFVKTQKWWRQGQGNMVVAKYFILVRHFCSVSSGIEMEEDNHLPIDNWTTVWRFSFRLHNIQVCFFVFSCNRKTHARQYNFTHNKIFLPKISELIVRIYFYQSITFALNIVIQIRFLITC